MTQDKSYGQIARAAFNENAGDFDASFEDSALAVRDAVMAHVINRMKLYAMLHAKPGKSAMEYSHGLLEWLGALHPVAAEDAK